MNSGGILWNYENASPLKGKCSVEQVHQSEKKVRVMKSMSNDLAAISW